MRRTVAAAVSCLALLASCGDSERGATRSGATTTTTTSTEGERTTTSTAQDSDGDGPTTTRPAGELPGERMEIFPYGGAALAVVGVAAEDTLNVRSGPGVSFEVVFDLDSLATGVTATGHNRSLESGGTWAEISYKGRTGWANTSFLLQPGRTHDVTSQVLAQSSRRPRAETMRKLGRMVAETRASEAPRSSITVVAAPTAGDVAEITIDVIGLGDDSVGGERLKIFAEPDRDGGGFTLRSVEATLLCSRGVTDDGLCT